VGNNQPAKSTHCAYFCKQARNNVTDGKNPCYTPRIGPADAEEVKSMDDNQSSRRRLATLDEVKRDLLPLPKSTLYDRARYGKLPGVVRVGRRIFVDLDVLETWIDNGGDTAN
jgi:hypothetical protein